MTAFDDLSLLRAFVGIMECGSISAGARSLKIPQPTLSRSLRMLEQRCGTALLRRVTAELGLSSRPLHLIQEGCDVGILPGKITDESVVARPAGTIALHLAAAPSLVQSRPAARQPTDLQAWPWIGLGGLQFWSAKEVKLFARNGVEQTLHVSPVLISEGVTSLREAVRAGLGVAVLPDGHGRWRSWRWGSASAATLRYRATRVQPRRRR